MLSTPFREVLRPLIRALGEGYGGGFSPAMLFTAGEQGAVYDPADFNSYMATGSELVVNGTFDSGTTGWTAQNSALSASNGELVVNSAGAPDAQGEYRPAFTPGKTYLVVAHGRAGTAVSGFEILAETNAVSLYSSGASTSTTLTRAAAVVTVPSGSTDFIIRMRTKSAGTAYFDNISVKELTAISSATMYQDSAGTTPVTAVGQPVGLILDKRLGAVRGAELWNDASVTFTGGSSRTSAGVYRIVTADATASYAELSGVLTVGKTYEVTFDVTAFSGAGIRVDVGGTVGQNLTTTGLKRFIVTASSNTAVRFIRNSTATDATVASVSLKEIPGNHATQSTAASRPTLSARYNQLLSTEDISTGTWTKSAGAAPSATLFVPDSTSAIHRISQPLLGTTGATFKVKGRVKGAGVRYVYVNTFAALGAAICIDTQTASTVSTGASVGNVTASLAADGYVDFSYTGVDTGASDTIFVQANTALSAADTTYTGNNVDGFHVTQLDARLSADASLAITSYQRVNTATDYDTTGFPLYLSFDGVDDSLATGSIDFSATNKCNAFLGVTNNTDAVQALVELGTTGGVSTDGFGLVLTGVPAIEANLFGGGLRNLSAPAQSAAPRSRVITGVFDIAAGSVAAQIAVRVNGAAVGAGVGPGQPTGNLPNAVLYIGRRGGSTLPFNGRLYSLIVRGAATDAALLSRAERFVGSRMGIAL